MLEQLRQIDRVVFYWINRDHQSTAFDWLMPFLSSEGHFKILFVVVFVLLLVFGKGRGRTAALLVIPLLVLSDQTSSHFLKHAFMRVRPCHLLPEVHLLAGCSDSYAMPSSHAANSAAAAAHFALFYPRLWAPLALLAFAVGYSRVYVGVHWPTDVLIGFLVGVAAAFTIHLAYTLAESAWQRRTAKTAPR